MCVDVDPYKHGNTFDNFSLLTDDFSLSLYTLSKQVSVNLTIHIYSSIMCQAIMLIRVAMLGFVAATPCVEQVCGPGEYASQVSIRLVHNE